MFTRIHTKVMVAGWFKKGSFIPQKFVWSNKHYLIDSITLTSDVKDGGIAHRIYGVVAGTSVFRLDYNRTTEAWWLEEVWCD